MGESISIFCLFDYILWESQRWKTKMSLAWKEEQEVGVPQWLFDGQQMQWVRKVRKKLPSTWFSLLSDLTPLSIRNKQTPHRYTNGSVLAGVLCYFLCEYVCVATSHPSLKVCFCVVAVKWGFVYLLAHECESVCVVTSEGIHFCGIWMKVRVMTTISILSSFPPEFICLCPVHVRAHMLQPR